MSEAFESIRQGLQEAIAHAKGEPVAACPHPAPRLIPEKPDTS